MPIEKRKQIPNASRNACKSIFTSMDTLYAVLRCTDIYNPTTIYVKISQSMSLVALVTSGYPNHVQPMMSSAPSAKFGNLFPRF